MLERGLRPECQREAEGAALPGFSDRGFRCAVVNLHLRPSRLRVLAFLHICYMKK